jgi:type IV pilus assembly protein PilW
MKLTRQRNLRNAVNLIESDLLLAGYDPLRTGNFGITDVRLDSLGNGTLTFTFDYGSPSTSDNGTLNSEETIQYTIFDSPLTSLSGLSDLGRKSGGGVELLAECIEAIGFAYAFDADGDGILDFNDDDLDGIMDNPPSGNENIYWAVDSNGDNLLDTNLDTNKDGFVDVMDGTSSLGFTVNTENIRAVKIFVLARTRAPDKSYRDKNTYVVGFRKISNPNDGFRRQIFTSTVKCRNLGL